MGRMAIDPCKYPDDAAAQWITFEGKNLVPGDGILFTNEGDLTDFHLTFYLGGTGVLHTTPSTGCCEAEIDSILMKWEWVYRWAGI